jgi:uncharacterized low-complexity protein
LRGILLNYSCDILWSNFIELKCSAVAEKADAKTEKKATMKETKATDGKCGEGKYGDKDFKDKKAS